MNYGDVDKDAVKSAMRKAFTGEEAPSERLADLLRRIAEADRVQKEDRAARG